MAQRVIDAASFERELRIYDIGIKDRPPELVQYRQEDTLGDSHLGMKISLPQSFLHSFKAV